MSIEFQPWPKIPRWSRDIVITEKLDGTNASIYIDDLGPITLGSGRVVPFLVGSRTRWIYPESDNYGFARWAYDNQGDLAQLGPGHHFGEWWGAGIQRRYGLKKKYFSLFNVGRWNVETPPPSICNVVPVLYKGPNYPGVIDVTMETLEKTGSHSVHLEGVEFRNPEGIVIFHTGGGNNFFKKTFEKDEGGKDAA